MNLQENKITNKGEDNLLKEKEYHLKFLTMEIKRFIIFMLIFTASLTAFAQSEKLQAMENELVFIQKTAAHMWNYTQSMYLYSHLSFEDFQYYEIIDLLCRQFDNMLTQMLVEDKEMNYPFTKLQTEKNGLLNTSITWSKDSSLRVFSWFLPGGTMHFYGNAIQYKSANSTVRSFSFADEGNGDDISSGYEMIYTLKEKNRTIYILSGATMGQSMFPVYTLKAFSIDDELVLENIFEDEDGGDASTISVGYDMRCSNIDGSDFSRFIIDEEEKTMNFPEIKEDCFTGKCVKYKFDGKKFVIK